MTRRSTAVSELRSRALSDSKKLKIGVKEGGGPPPGYLWNALILDDAFREAMRMFGDAQYGHMALQVKQLASEQDPTHSLVLSVRKIEDFRS